MSYEQLLTGILTMKFSAVDIQLLNLTLSCQAAKFFRNIFKNNNLAT